MADIKLSVRAEALGESLDNLGYRIEEELKAAVKNLADTAYNSMIADVQMSPWMRDTEKKQYQNALKFQNLGDDNYLIYLDGDEANKLEDGVPSYVMNPGMLSSEKIVNVGSRAGQPWVRKNKKGEKYAAVPFTHHPMSKAPGNDLATAIKGILVKNAQGVDQKITQIFRDVDGNALSGKVAVASEFETPIQNLQGLTKYQSISPTGKVSSVYMTYRTITEKGKAWIMPARPGFHLFKKTQEYIEQELDNIIRTIVS
jgi:hypothetical protein